MYSTSELILPFAVFKSPSYPPPSCGVAFALQELGLLQAKLTLCDSSRMNAICRSSFDTNLRITVSTPTGQRALQTESSGDRRNTRARQHTTRDSSGWRARGGYTTSTIPVPLHKRYCRSDPVLSTTHAAAAVPQRGAAADYEVLRPREAREFDNPAIGSLDVQNNVWVEASSQATEVSAHPVASDGLPLVALAYSQQTSSNSNRGPALSPGEKHNGPLAPDGGCMMMRVVPKTTEFLITYPPPERVGANNGYGEEMW